MAEADIMCFSYLAEVSTLHVEQYPSADHGCAVSAVERFLAGDGPIVAGTAAALGLRARLLSNSVAADAGGAYLNRRLDEWGVLRGEPATVWRSQTPSSTVVCDVAGTRTFFPYLPDVEKELGAIDLDVLGAARVLYVDCYAVIEVAARRVVTQALRLGLPIMVNLGGSRLPPWLVEAAAGRRLKAIQTNAVEGDEATMLLRASQLAAADVAEIVLVTAGRDGAVAMVGRETVTAPALEVVVAQVQGAGAVFSAAFMTGLLFDGAEVSDALRLATTMGSMWCERTPDARLPRRPGMPAASPGIRS